MDQSKVEQVDMDMCEHTDTMAEQFHVQCRDADSSCWEGAGEQNNNNR